MTPEELQGLKQSAAKFDYVRFSFADICGSARGETVPRRNVDRFLRDGIGLFAGTVLFGPMSELPMVPEVADTGFGNATLLPESTTSYPVPWAGHGKYKVGEVICETHWLDGSYQEAAPRTVARKQLQKLKDRGFILKSAFEMEFMLEHAKTGEPVWEGVDAFSHKLVAKQEEILFQIDQQLLESGVSIEKIQSEYSPGQYEMSLEPEFGTKAADNTFIFKHGVKEIAMQKGLLANFMTVPRFNHCGNAAHCNHSLWTTDMKQNVFFDASKDNNLSDIADWWLGGLCQHAPAITALCSPTVNCYRRLHSLWVPDRANWGIENRLTSFRVKNQSASGCLVENRIASGNCNPYLVIAAIAAAGLDGIINKIPCPQEYDKEAMQLPFTLQDALDELQKDKAITEALGSEFIRWFVAIKEQVDLKKLERSDPKTNDEEMIAEERKMYSLYI